MEVYGFTFGLMGFIFALVAVDRAKKTDRRLASLEECSLRNLEERVRNLEDRTPKA